MTVEEKRRELSFASKRRLRRERIAALKDGVEIPYDPSSQPVSVDKDAPKLTNTAKRHQRWLKKEAAQMEASGFLGDENTALIALANWKKNYLTLKKNEENMSNENETRKQKKRRKTVESDYNVSSDKTLHNIGKEKNIERKLKIRKKDEPGHIRFDDSDPEDHVVQDEIETLHKKRKKRKKEKKPKEPKERKKDEPGHIRFDDSDPEEPTEEDEIKHNSKKVEKSTIDCNSPTVEVADTNDEPANSETKHIKKKDESGKIIDTTQPFPEKRRLVLFVDNLSHDTTEEDVRAHFNKVGPIVSVQIAREVDDNIKSKCRGFCHLELENEETYLKALSLNHTFMAKHRITVEYSSGQTKELKADQKKKSYNMGASFNSRPGFKVRNPVGNPSKAIMRSKARQVTQNKGNTFWV